MGKRITKTLPIPGGAKDITREVHPADALHEKPQTPESESAAAREFNQDASFLAEGLGPGVDLALGLLFGDPVEFLEFSEQHIFLARNHLQVIVGQLSPLLSGKAFVLSPLAFNLIPVHMDGASFLGILLAGAGL
jgi:hypothetical protein